MLAALTGRDDVVFGAIVSGRPPELAGIETMIGLFINTLPVRIRLRPGETVGALLERVQAEQTALLDHHYIGLAEIQSSAGPEVGFDTLTVFESYPVDREGLSTDTDIAGMRVDGVQARDAAHYPLSLVASVDSRLRLKFEYLPDIFDVDTVDGIAGRVLRVLDACTRPGPAAGRAVAADGPRTRRPRSGPRRSGRVDPHPAADTRRGGGARPGRDRAVLPRRRRELPRPRRAVESSCRARSSSAVWARRPSSLSGYRGPSTRSCRSGRSPRPVPRSSRSTRTIPANGSRTCSPTPERGSA